MEKNTSLKTRSTASFFTFFSVRSSFFAVAVLSLVSISSGHAAEWLNETFEQYTVAAPATAPTTALSPLLQQISSGSTVVGTAGNQMCRYSKPTATSLTVAGLQYSLSPANATPRPKGFFSFKIVQNTPPSPAISSSDFSLRLGSNDSTTMGGSASAFIDVRFTPSTTATCLFSVRSGTVDQKVVTSVSATAQSTIKIWYNSENVGMVYTDPAGASQTLSAASYVCYVNNVLASSSASGTALLGVVTTSATSVTPPVTSSVIGKVAFQCASGKAVDFSIDDIYAGDTPPVLASLPITSTTTASAMVGYPFTFQVLAEATTYGATSLPDGLSINPTSGLITGTPLAAGLSTAALSVSNGAGVTGSGNLAITVATAPTSIPVMGGATTASGNVATVFNYQIVASNTPRSYAAATLPLWLSLNPATGLISGTPTTVGDTTVTLTAENPAGASSSQNLTISIGIAPPNIFTGSNASLNTSASWSLGTTPTASGNLGSYTDLVFSSSVFPLTTSSGNVLGKSWNVTNGNSYTFSSVATNITTFKIGNNNPVSSPFYNSVAGSENVLVYLVNGSSLTFSPLNTTTATPSSLASLFNSGTLQIGSGSILSILAPLIENGTSAVVTKIGSGKLLLGGSNSVSGGLILQEGAIDATVANSLGAGAVAVNGGQLDVSGENAWVGSKALTLTGGKATFSSSNNYTGLTTLSGGTLQLSNVAALGGSNTAGTFTLSGGTVQALADYDMGHTFTVLATNASNSSITFEKLDGKKTTVNGPVTLSATSGVTLSLFKLIGNSSANSVVTKTGSGTLRLMGGTPESGWIGDWRINEGTLFVNTTSSSALGSNNAVVMNGGNLRFSKGVSSTGAYTGHGQDNALSVLAETTITIDPNAATLASNNTVSFTNLSVGAQTIHVAKGASTKSSATEIGYTDPQLSFRSASLTGQATLDVAANVETVLQAGSGSGGVTKSGAGLLTLSDSTTITTTVVDAVTNSVTNTIANSYTGPTSIQAGTLALRGSHSSAISIGSGAALELTVVASNSPSTTKGLTLIDGAKVRPVGTPTLASYTLVTAAMGITGTPALETPIAGYSLVIEGNSLKLNVGNANTAPAITAAQGFSVAENASLGTVVGTVVATDADANSSLSAWTIDSGNTGGVFAINAATGQISVAGALNYEGTPSYSLGLTVSDGTATSAVGTVVVTVTNVSEYSDVFGSSSPTADDNGDGISNLMAYALGATSASSLVVPPALNTTDPTKLTMTASIRIDDLKVSVVGIYGLAPGSWVTGSPITGVPSSSQTGVVAGVTQRQDFSVLRGTDSKKFMYLKATQAP